MAARRVAPPARRIIEPEERRDRGTLHPIYPFYFWRDTPLSLTYSGHLSTDIKEVRGTGLSTCAPKKDERAIATTTALSEGTKILNRILIVLAVVAFGYAFVTTDLADKPITAGEWKQHLSSIELR